MNEATFLAEQINAKKAVEAGLIEPNTFITGQRLEDGSYHVLGRYANTTWVLPDILSLPVQRKATRNWTFHGCQSPFGKH